jgi:NADPH2:quinone reductase
MKSCWIRSVAGKTEFEFRELAVPKPGPDELLVKVHASAMNRGELLANIGWHDATVPKPAGRELSGEVVDVGAAVAGFRIGDRIMARAHGAFSEYVAVPMALATTIPDALSDEQAAAVPIAYVTAHVSVCTYGAVQPGETVLITGVSSGVGVASLQVAKYFGARVIGTSRSKEKLARLKGAELDVGIVTTSSDLAAQVLEATAGQGVNLAVNLVGGSLFPDCVRALAKQGRLVVAGYVDGVLKNEIDLDALHAKRLEIYGVSNTFLTRAERAEGTRTFARDLMPGFASGKLVPLIDRIYGFEELPEAKRYVEADRHVGKVVIRF